MFLERMLDPPMSRQDFLGMATASADCFGMHRVAWHRSLLSTDGRKLVCWFSAADLESVRIALRQVNADMRRLWPGSVHDAPGLTKDDIRSANILVERSFEDSVELQDIQNIEDAGGWCLETRNVRFIRTYFSNDRKRMICLYEAPDAESVRQAQREAGVPFDEAWAYIPVGPSDL
jgi:hypothetical protein